MTRRDGRRRLVVLNWRDRRHPSAGGAELYCERLAREAAARGHDVVVVASRPAGTAARERVDGYEVRRLGGWRTVYPLALLWLLKHRASLAGVVDSQNGVPFFSPLVTGRRTPVVLLVHHVHQDLFASALRPAAARLARWLEGPASRRVYRGRTVVVLSPSRRAEVRRRLGFDGPVRVVPCGADTQRLVAVRSAAPRIVVVGRLTPYKRLGRLVDVMPEVQQHLPGAELHLVGDGPARPALERLARAAGARAVFHGRLPDARRDEVLGTAWLTVSTSDGSDWGLSLVEANAAGVPALARRVSGLRDAVRHGDTGWLVDASVEDLGQALVQALTTLADPVAAARIADGARAWAAQFTWARTAEGVLQALDQERARLEHRRARTAERRSGNDVMVVLTLPEAALPNGWEALRRSGDVWASDGTTARALLAGADEVDVRTVLERYHIDADDPSVSVLVARHADVLGRQQVSPQDAVQLVDAVARRARDAGPDGAGGAPAVLVPAGAQQLHGGPDAA